MVKGFAWLNSTINLPLFVMPFCDNALRSIRQEVFCKVSSVPNVVNLDV
jgi:hypothetical protein